MSGSVVTTVLVVVAVWLAGAICGVLLLGALIHRANRRYITSEWRNRS